MLGSDWTEHCALDPNNNTERDAEMFREHGFCFPQWAVTIELGHRFIADYGSRAAMSDSADRHVAKGWRGVAIMEINSFEEIEQAERDMERLEDWATDY